jgi:hypothetical protein
MFEDADAAVSLTTAVFRGGGKVCMRPTILVSVSRPVVAIDGADFLSVRVIFSIVSSKCREVILHLNFSCTR